ncbi:MAG: YlxR family protein [Chloroflexota bacterium]|nr:YlxR family protein [Chloroflexota bacterium]
MRVVRDADGGLSVDLRGKAPGRGAYLCSDDACLERGIDEGSLGPALEVTIDEATRRRLRDELAAGAEKRIGEGGLRPTEAAGPPNVQGQGLLTRSVAKPAQRSGLKRRM